ncbi:SBBP repeat-containing protein [Methanoplanus limicola]|uniref:Beta-propeller repeat-containing protein n=1 Tax=Methanoplanus limicola DSM 2279 TaxID=937775 RepID=H1YZQ1_9EURY|nr:SBBP repeat-containing protein [Methanoplanus limicola]EHQ34313.1 beta-propeller repeat-containing protein [Methanoplanus limicola DSM 2279]
MSLKTNRSGKKIFSASVIIILFSILLLIQINSVDTYSLAFNNTYEISKTNAVNGADCESYKDNIEVTNINSSVIPVFSSYFGGKDTDSVNSVSIGKKNNLTAITGVTQSEDFPLTENNQKKRAGNIDGFIALINSNSKKLLYSGFIGGKGSDKPVSSAFNNEGNLYIAGYTDSDDFFTTKDALQKNNRGKWDIFLVKININNFETEYSTLIGGSSSDVLHDITIDSNNNLYLTGTTESRDFPVTKGAFQEKITGKRDAFLMKINPEENIIVYCTFFGGVSDDYSEAVGIDSELNAYITGYTYSSKTRSLPVKNEIFGPSTFSYDSYIAAFNPDGSDLIYSTYIGGGGGDRAKGIAVTEKRVHIAGYTYSDDLFVKNAFQNNFSVGNGSEGFLTCLNKEGTEIIYSTYFGGENDDFIHAIKSDNRGNIIIAGETKSENIFSSKKYDIERIPDEKRLKNNSDAFIAVFQEDSGSMNSAILIQGNDYDVIYDVDGYNGKLITAGMTKSDDIDGTEPVQKSNAGSYDGLITEYIIADK